MKSILTDEEYLALCQCPIDRNMLSYDYDINKDDPSQILIECMDWHSTPQGEKYWVKVNNRIKGKPNITSITEAPSYGRKVVR
jgi:hypothetical protein